MAMIVARAWFPQLLAWMALNSRSLKLHLFRNDHVPDETDTLVDYEESTWVGYTPKLLDHWGTPTIDVNNRGRIQHALETFTYTGGGPAEYVYGYYITDSAGANLVAAERNPDGPVYVADSGDMVDVIVRLTDRNDPNPM